MLNNIKDKLKLLSINNPVILLDVMSDGEIYLVQEILKDYENIEVFVIEKIIKKEFLLNYKFQM